MFVVRQLPTRVAAMALVVAAVVATLGFGQGTAAAATTTCTDRQLPVSSTASYLGVDRRHSAQFRGVIVGGVTNVNFWFDGVYRGQFRANGLLVTGTAPISALYKTVTTTEIWLGKVRQVVKSVPYLRVCGSYWIKLS
ncbi:hypothetical protein CcI49_23645 [Frankia sp. CcI49]|uniref:hypothetical protein n=2 Tax=unclassified Frankia TaxID=2632575 RepID=UPI0006CA41C0|nr:hypothetical protein [Frankia sp. R43]KPM57466.1 hypothetical protein ACG83_07205 [Frankia sp. R43]ONH57937.1 hypothetical protein CcI49_23645 [Frankia sp. CcI49]